MYKVYKARYLAGETSVSLVGSLETEWNLPTCTFTLSAGYADRWPKCSLNLDKI